MGLHLTTVDKKIELGKIVSYLVLTLVENWREKAAELYDQDPAHEYADIVDEYGGVRAKAFELALPHLPPTFTIQKKLGMQVNGQYAHIWRDGSWLKEIEEKGLYEQALDFIRKMVTNPQDVYYG
jgi:hypothetical protein